MNVVIPGHRVRHAVDVIPAAGIEPDEMLPERGADFHELETRFDLLDEHIALDAAIGQPQVLLERRKNVTPESGFLGGLNLRHIQDERAACLAEPFMVVRR